MSVILFITINRELFATQNLIIHEDLSEEKNNFSKFLLKNLKSTINTTQITKVNGVSGRLFKS